MGEQPLPPYGACLLGSVNLCKFIDNPLTDTASFDWEKYEKVVGIFSRMLDNVVDINNLPLPQQREEILNKRRHGMGFLGLGSALNLLGLPYGSKESLEFTEQVAKRMALVSYRQGALLAKEKGPCPLLLEKANLDKWLQSKYLKGLFEADPELYELLKENGCRYTHATSIAPTGTISLSLNNNVSNGIEPTFAHKYTRNVIKEGKKSKEAVDVYSFEVLVYKEMFGGDEIPDSFSTTDNITWKEHVDIQAVAQKWVDSSISKTINVPSDIPFDEFKDVYLYGYECGLKGLTTFKFNPEAFQGVLVTEEDLKATKYTFETDTGDQYEVSGDTVINYDGEDHSAANLYDAIKEGYYGKF